MSRAAAAPARRLRAPRGAASVTARTRSRLPCDDASAAARTRFPLPGGPAPFDFHPRSKETAE
jgi:hypothetical protein